MQGGRLQEAGSFAPTITTLDLTGIFVLGVSVSSTPIYQAFLVQAPVGGQKLESAMAAAEVPQHNVEVPLSKEPYPQMLGVAVWASRLTRRHLSLSARARATSFVGSRLHVFVVL